MVKTTIKPLYKLFAICLCYIGWMVADAYAAYLYPVEADACDQRKDNDDVKTAENRAVDKAGLSAVKLSNVIQKNYPDLSVSALDIIAYRIIDDYMINTSHEITIEDEERICVKLFGTIEISPDQLALLVEEYKESDSPEEVIAVAEKVKAQTSFKPQNLNDKKLLYIDSMEFWNGNGTSHYKDLLTGLFSNSEYFYVTEDKKAADYIVKPRLLKAEVDEIDNRNHKMQIQIEIEISSGTLDDFKPIREKQGHFILFAADKDEQSIADNLLRKLLTKAANNSNTKLNNYSAQHLEKNKMAK